MGIRRQALGSDYVLAIDPDGSTNGLNYRLIVCLTSNSFDRTSNQIDASSKCGPATIPGAQTISVPFEFQDILDTDNGEISEDVLHPLWQNRTIVGWKFGKITPGEGDVTYTGLGYITQLNTTSPNDGIVTTSGILSD